MLGFSILINDMHENYIILRQILQINNKNNYFNYKNNVYLNSFKKRKCSEPSGSTQTENLFLCLDISTQTENVSNKNRLFSVVIILG